MLLVRFVLLLCLSLVSVAHAEQPAWHKVAYQPTNGKSLSALAHKQHALFAFFLDNALRGKGRKDFLTVSKQVKNNITWRNGQGNNIYSDAFRRSWPFVRSLDLKGMPDSILLLAYLESQWHGHKGRTAGDYGYWQLVPEVIQEIQQLDYVPAKIRATDIDSVRADARLSTEVAQVHLHRYHFYFANVAGFSESDAWLLTFTAFNWGAGNVKRLIAELQAEGIEANYANFYQRLYATHRKNPGDRSLRAAVEYVPNLWNIAQLLKSEY